MEEPIRVVIVDDQRMFREGIRSRLAQEPDIRVVGEAASAEEVPGVIQQTQPTLVILDIRLPTVSGIEVARRLRQQWPELKILILTGYDFDQYVRAAARVGIQGYLLKDAPQESLVQAVREVAAGGAVLPPQIASKVMKSYAGAKAVALAREPDQLTVRELDILELLSQGLRNTQIAQRLSLSIRTVEAHITSLMSKLGAQSRTEAVKIGTDRKLIK